jgi:hypothetical protein
MTPVCEVLRASGARVIDAIGDTPLVRLSRIERDLPGIELYAKAEWLNPGGSVKDRPAARMICEALAAGHLTPERRILDSTSGNTGIAYAMIGASLGYGVTLCVPANITPERRRILRAYGPELVFTDPLEGSDGAIREARSRFAADPGRYFYADQYNNDFNCTLRLDRGGSVGADRRAADAFGRGAGHERDIHRHRQAVAGIQQRGRACLGATGCGVSRSRRAQAHGDGDRSGHLRSVACRLRPAGIDR